MYIEEGDIVLYCIVLYCIIQVGLRETVCEEGGLIEMSQNFVQFRALNANVLPPLPVFSRVRKIAKSDF